MKILSVLFFLATASPLICGEAVWSASEHDEKTIINYSRAPESKLAPSLEGLRQLLGRLEDGGSIKHVCFWDYFNQDAVIQAELFAVFQADFPEDLKEALESSGNMHNPKLLSLRKHFRASLMKTPTVIAINRIFHEEGYQISDISFEKFWIDKNVASPLFHAIVWLVVSPKAEKFEEKESDQELK